MMRYFRIILAKWWFIMLLGVISTGIGIYSNYFHSTKIYQASATVYVFQVSDYTGIDAKDKGQATYQNLVVSEMMAKDYKEIIKTELIFNQLMKELKAEETSLGNINYNTIINNISVNIKSSARVIEISMRYPDPEAAAIIVNKLAEVFVKESEQLTHIKNVTILNRAHPANRPISSKALENTVFTGMAGILSALAIILLWDFIANFSAREKNFYLEHRQY